MPTDTDGPSAIIAIGGQSSADDAGTTPAMLDTERKSAQNRARRFHVVCVQKHTRSALQEPMNPSETRGIAIAISPFNRRKSTAMMSIRREARVHLSCPRGGYFAGEIESGYCLDRPDIETHWLRLDVAPLII